MSSPEEWVGRLTHRIYWTQTEEDAVTSWTGLGERQGTDLLAITSGGCTALGFLALGAGSVVSLDVNPAQTQILELKRAAMAALDWEGFQALLGVAPTDGNEERYERLRGCLSEEGREFWDENKPLFTQHRLVGAGVVQGAPARLRDQHPDEHERLAELFSKDDVEEQVALFEGKVADAIQHIAEFRMRGAEVLLGPPSEKAIEIVGLRFALRLRRSLENFLFRDSPWASHILLGRYQPGVFPPYMTRTGFETAKNRLDALTHATKDLRAFVDELPEQSLDGADLSNVSDFLSQEDFHQLCQTLVRVLRPGGRIVHRNLLLTESFPAAPGFERDEELSAKLHAGDKAFMYWAFSVDRLAEA